jgi:hypothetical protein
MRSRARGWIMPAEDIPSMIQMIEEKIASSEIEVHHRDRLIRLKNLLEDDLEQIRNKDVVGHAEFGINEDYPA